MDKDNKDKNLPAEKEKIPLMVGDKIKVDEKFHEGLDKIIENARNAQTGYEEAVRKMRIINEELFNYIHEAYPETKGMNLNFNQKTKEVLILGTVNPRGVEFL